MRAHTRPTFFAAAVVALFAAGPVGAQAIIGPTSGVINSGGPGFNPLSATFDQSGLSAGYTSGVTNFNTYVAGTTHSYVFACCEWFSEVGTSASVTYDLGSVTGIDALALWNEDASGIGTLDLYGSVNGTNFFALSLGITPVDNLLNVDYGAQVFGFTGQNVQYVRFDMTNCPQPEAGIFDACAIGEVGFRSAVVNAVPEPGTVVLLGTGLFAVGFVARRRRSA